MGQPAGTFSSYDAVGNREDLSGVISDISPLETPFTSSLATVKATATNHEFQVDSLAAAASNAVIEGDDATSDASSATTRLGNYTQIMDKVALVTGTQRAVDSAGRADEFDYQVMKKGKELKRDRELAFFANNAKVAGNDSTAREMAGVVSWIATNVSAGATATEPTGDGTDARGAGTARALLESDLKAVLASAYDNGGNPDTIYVGSFNKQAISAFSGNATRTVNGEAEKLSTAVHVYVSDFGELKVMPSRLMPQGVALAIDHSLWKIAELRGFQSQDLAKTGDSFRKQVLWEGTLEACNEAGNGIVADLTTS